MEEHYHQPWKKLLNASQYPSREAMGEFLEASGSKLIRQRRPAKNADLAKELEVARAGLDGTNKTINDFIRETARYRRAKTAVYYQKL